MIDAETARRLFAYTDWANERIAAALQTLTDGQFTRPLGGSFPSIAATLAHVLGAEWVWLQRWKGINPTQAPEWTHSSDRTVLLDHLRIVGNERMEWLASLTAERLATTLHGRRLSGEPLTMQLSDALLHVANHSTYHRGQIVNMLRQLGASAPSTDFSLYVTENVT